MGERKRIVRVGGLKSRSEVGTKRREETKVEYSMARVIARRHVRNARFKCDEEREKERLKEGKRRVKREGEKRGSREVAVVEQ